MQSHLKSIKEFLSKELYAYKPDPSILSEFATYCRSYLQKLDQAAARKESEEHQKILFSNFLKNSFPEYENINTYGRIDLAIRDEDDQPRVLIETKRLGNQSEMLTRDDFNRKALHESLLYFYRLSQGSDFSGLTCIMITNCEQIYLFRAREFNELCKNEKIKSCLDYHLDKMSDSVEKTEELYKQLKKILDDDNDLELTGGYVDLRECDDEEQCQVLWKFLSPHTLLRMPLSNDANHLNEKFYRELLHIVGLKEYENGLKYNGDEGSMLGCAIGELKNRRGMGDDEAFETAFALNILWLNRILFLKILEALLTGFSGGASPKFLDEKKIKHPSDLSTLFFRVLAIPRESRRSVEEWFSHIPYLNSSLFEETEAEILSLSIDQMPSSSSLAVMSGSILKDKESKLTFLTYLIRFLNCYQFNKEAEFTDVNTVITSSVLGLVFEKLNGYQGGAHFTPARITMRMARRTIRQLVLQKFNQAFNKDYKNFEDLQNWVIKLDDSDEEAARARKIVDGLRIFDPAVGSGHFLVSCLNELVKVKRDLCLADHWREYGVEIRNDELVITVANGDPFHYVLKEGKINKTQETIQKSLFEIKRNIIENQLYGIDINPNSVNICRLRLWIELLKHTYYTDEECIDLHTLPNLEFKVMTADSIVRLKKFGELVHTRYTDTLAELRQFFSAYFEADAGNKRALRENIRQTLEEIKGMRVGVQGSIEKAIEQFDPFNLSVSNPFFDSELMFGVKNFDIVIGNPPYIQLQNIPKDKNSYAHSDQGFKTYTATGDIYQLFMERAFDWISEEGLIHLIVSNKWMRAAYGQKTRAMLYEQAQVYELIDLGGGNFTALRWTP